MLKHTRISAGEDSSSSDDSEAEPAYVSPVREGPVNKPRKKPASRKRAAVPADDASEDQPSWARTPFSVCTTCHS